ncbi:SWIM zinc finger family protein [Catenulispora sp. NF23]|uniref:SWIM zinc finger family protein n=1 Tax=Catenulispora pinistramenti TaxID=2705254 RepID=A0ABS5KMS4_9ACTN|nr:SWIM zinc finger family protein [Catenulispora pinistramenti]MBS2531396.1 SWIM zinc finger family protein [Catenulispora pinistramenti]MBS2547328.1 SWIM zinc finger family protein [Catenulispora pinistramenti]
MDALETTSMDAARLTRGRTYARRGAVEDITVTPGLATAKVQGSRPRPYTSTVEVKQLSDADWDRLLTAVAARAAHIAALLDKDMPPELLDDAKAAGVRLLPAAGDLSPECSCPDWGWPCKHASALCYQIARLLDTDPFVLLLLRGRGEQELMEELRTRNAAVAAVTAAAATTATATAHDSGSGRLGTETPSAVGVSAVEAFSAAPSGTAALLASITAFEIPAASGVPGQPPVLAAATGEAVGTIDAIALERLVADTAGRAHTLLTLYSGLDEPAATPLIPQLTTWQDAVRMAADEDEAVSEEVFERVLFAYDLGDVQMAMSILAWRQGGTAGLSTLETPWAPTAADKARARQSLDDWTADGDPPTLRLWRNRWTAEAEGVQVRLGTDHRWYPYRRDPEDGTWWPHGVPEHDPASALATLLTDADRATGHLGRIRP